MANSEIFVGRKEELNAFTKALENPRGQAIIVVGNRGMGKTWLVNQMAKLASKHPTLKCGFVRYEVTPTDSPDSTMTTMMDNAFEAGQVKEGSFDGTKRGLEQWRSFLNIFNLGDLALSLRRDPTKDTRQQFMERLELISKRMPEKGRAIFIVDPEKYTAKDSDQTWAIVIKSLPDKIKFVFAQRTEDVLVGSEVIDGLDNVVKIPSDTLDALGEEDVDELVDCRKANLPVSIPELQKILKHYEGHPYAVGAALDLVEQGTKLEELPKKPEPTKFAELQWKKVCETSVEAMKLLEAYAILEVAVPDDIVEYVSEIEVTTRKRLQNDKYLRGLLREEAGGKRIYHSILADYILGQMNDEKKKEYHKRAAEVYRGKLKKAKKEQTKPDELVAVRLPNHVLMAEGEEKFVITLVNECGKTLLNLGLLDVLIGFSEQALKLIKKGSMGEAAIRGNLGRIYYVRGDLDKAEEAFKNALEINLNLKRPEVLLNIVMDYNGLCIIYGDRGELDKAEKMHRNASVIVEKLLSIRAMTNLYGNALHGLMADQCSNIGMRYIRQGKWDEAEKSFKKSLEIDEKIRNNGGMASSYNNLGGLYQLRGDLNKAEEMHKKALVIAEKLGHREEIARDYGNLGAIYAKQGKSDKAEQMFKKALDVNEKLGRQEGIAKQYCNIGSLYKERGDFKSAMEYWEKGLDLFKKIGMPNEVKMLEELIEKMKEK